MIPVRAVPVKNIKSAASTNNSLLIQLSQQRHSPKIGLSKGIFPSISNRIKLMTYFVILEFAGLYSAGLKLGADMS